MRTLLVLILSFFAGTTPGISRGAQELPSSLQGIQIRENLGATLSASRWEFKDSTGRVVHLSDYLHTGKPVVLTLAYYACPHLCTLVLNGLKDALQSTRLQMGRDFQVVTVSIDPREKPELAAKKKQSYLEALSGSGGQPEAASAWHFLTGAEAQIKGLAEEVGFGYRWVPEENQFAHGAAIFVLTPDAKISRILYGVEFRDQDFKLALVEASQGKIGTVIDRFLLFCYRYDPKTRRYSIVLTRIVQLSSAATVVIMGSLIGRSLRRRRQRKGA